MIADSWEDLEKVIADVKETISGEWEWYKNTRCKYVSIRIDTRDGHAIICDRYGNAITLKELRYQYPGKE